MDILVRVGDFGNIFSNHIIDSHHILSLGSVWRGGGEGGGKSFWGEQLVKKHQEPRK